MRVPTQKHTSQRQFSEIQKGGWAVNLFSLGRGWRIVIFCHFEQFFSSTKSERQKRQDFFSSFQTDKQGGGKGIKTKR